MLLADYGGIHNRTSTDDYYFVIYFCLRFELDYYIIG